MKKILVLSILFAFFLTHPAFSADAPAAEIEMPSTNGSLELSPKIQEETSLRVAARSGRLKDVKRLLDDGVDVNGSGEFGETALMYAARYGFSQVVEILLTHGAETNSRDAFDNTALHMAAKNCSVNSAQLILSKGVNVNWINSQGKSPLIEASEQGCFPLVRLLIRTRGLDLAQKDNQMNTALDYAMEEAFAEVGGPYSMISSALRDAGAPTSQWVTAVVHPKNPEPAHFAETVGPTIP